MAGRTSNASGSLFDGVGRPIDPLTPTARTCDIPGGFNRSVPTMRFDIERDPVRIANIQTELADRHNQMMRARGALLRYDTPSLPNAFPRLNRILESSPHRTQFRDIYYHIRSDDGRIERLIPAADYYKFVFQAVADKRHALELGLGRIREVEHWIQRYYHEIRDPMLRGTQPSYRVVDQVYALKSELGNILFVARGALDSIATLFHFLYGPSSFQCSSFAAFVKYLEQGHAGGTDPDPAMREYIGRQLAWFRTLHEYRDYVTHFGSIDITFYELEEGVVRTYLQDALEVHEVVAPVLSGLDAFCGFVDGHFAGRITQASLGASNTT
jgi:hypothetical protein